MHAYHFNPPDRIIRSDDGYSTLLSGNDIVRRFDSEWVSGAEQTDVSFIARAASSYDSLVAAVHMTLGLLPEMNLTMPKAKLLNDQLQRALGDAMQEPQITDPSELERRKPCRRL